MKCFRRERAWLSAAWEAEAKEARFNLALCKLPAKKLVVIHCLVEFAKVEKQHEKSWYKAIGCDVRGDDL